VSFFQKNNELKADYIFFTEVRDRLFLSSNSVVRLIFLMKTEDRWFFKGRVVYLRCVKFDLLILTDKRISENTIQEIEPVRR